MAFLVSVKPLRRSGARLETLGPPQEGFLVIRRHQSAGGLVLVSNTGGVTLLGPLYEARVLNASIDGLVLLGYEKEGGAAYVQEWLVGPFSGTAGGKLISPTHEMPVEI